jgi:hypothetical protein
VHLPVEGELLAVDAPKGLLTDDLHQAIRQYKQELLALLAPPMPAAGPLQPTAPAPPEPLTPHYPCTVCGKVERWDDAGVWQCKTCWPAPLTELARQAEAIFQAGKAQPHTTLRDPGSASILTLYASGNAGDANHRSIHMSQQTVPADRV